MSDRFETTAAEAARCGASAASFRTTRWTQVGLAKADSNEGRRALHDLCQAYYEPVTAFLKSQLQDTDTARELTHEFFAYMLAGGAFAGAEQDRGRFRSYLLGAVKHFLAHRREAARRLKRGSGVECLSIDDEESGVQSMPAANELPPDAAYDRQWALTVLARAMDALRLECAGEGRGHFFDQLKPCLIGEAEHGEQAALAARLGISASVLKVTVHRLRQRFRERVAEEIAETLDDPEMVKAEMQVLYAALGA